MNESEIDISSSSQSSSSSSSRSTSPVCDKSSSNISSNDNQLNQNLDEEEDNSHIIKTHTTTNGELTLETLPAIENLSIKVKIEELTQLGRVSSIVDCLVVIQPFKSIRPLDLDSILFLRDSKPLGKIFDIFGPVIKPMYAVRFNSFQDIEKLNIKVDTPVYYLPEYSPPITSYVFTEDLKKIKGSDASWLYDNEPPEDALDFSDDENERLSLLKRRAKRTSSKELNSLENNSFQELLNHKLAKPSLALDSHLKSPLSMAVPPNSPSTPFGENSTASNQNNFGLFSDLTELLSLSYEDPGSDENK